MWSARVKKVRCENVSRKGDKTELTGDDDDGATLQERSAEAVRDESGSSVRINGSEWVIE